MATTTTHTRDYSIGSTVNYMKGLMAERPKSLIAKGMEQGLHTLIAKSVLRRLPPPLNVVVPMAVEKLVIRHGVEEGREILLKGLRWVKKVTDEPAS